MLRGGEKTGKRGKDREKGKENTGKREKNRQGKGKRNGLIGARLV